MSEYPEVLPPRQAFPYCCRPGCPNPAAHAELVTGIGTHVVTGAPLRCVRFLCVWHGRGHMTLADYDEQRAAELVRARLLRHEWEWPVADVEMTHQALSKMSELVANPPEPSERLKAAARRYRRYAQQRVSAPTAPQVVDAKKPSR